MNIILKCKEPSGPVLEFSKRDIIDVINFAKTGPSEIRVSGHDILSSNNFEYLIETLVENNFKITANIDHISEVYNICNLMDFLTANKLSFKDIIFCVDFNDLNLNKEFFLKNLNNYSYLSFTVDESIDNHCKLLETIHDYKLHKKIKLRMNSTCCSLIKENPEKFKNLSVFTTLLCSEFMDNGIEIVLSCGISMCMLDRYDKIVKDKKVYHEFSCGQAMDVYPELGVTNCPKIKNPKISLNNFINYDDLRTFFKGRYYAPIKAHCKCCDCKFLNKMCSGGCKGI